MTRFRPDAGAGTLRVKAALFATAGAPLELVDVEVRPPMAHEIRVRLAASGVCHTDQTIFSGGVPLTPPLVLGHEGAGIIESVGADVIGLDVGDHVVLTWMTQCGSCFYCAHDQPELCTTKSSSLEDVYPRLTVNGQTVTPLSGVGSFASAAVLDAAAATKIPDDVRLTSACLIGCGVLTGIGAALNTAKVARGEVVAVIGCGGVGLNVIQGSRLAGTAEIIAIDRTADKLKLATRFGATSTILASDPEEVLSAVRELTGGRGADVTFEVVGSPQVARQALDLTRPGGRLCIVGAAPLTATMEVPMYMPLVSQQKSILGCRGGSVNIRRDIPRIVEWYRRGELLLDELVGNIVALENLNGVLANLDTSTVARTLIGYDV